MQNRHLQNPFLNWFAHHKFCKIVNSELRFHILTLIQFIYSPLNNLSTFSEKECTCSFSFLGKGGLSIFGNDFDIVVGVFQWVQFLRDVQLLSYSYTTKHLNAFTSLICLFHLYFLQPFPFFLFCLSKLMLSVSFYLYYKVSSILLLLEISVGQIAKFSLYRKDVTKIME